MGYAMIILIVIILGIILCSIKQVEEYERGILFTFGKFSRILSPGWNIVLPIFQSFKKVDVRTIAVDVPEQDAITKDNVSIRINAVIYYNIFDASKAVFFFKNYKINWSNNVADCRFSAKIHDLTSLGKIARLPVPGLIFSLAVQTLNPVQQLLLTIYI